MIFTFWQLRGTEYPCQGASSVKFNHDAAGDCSAAPAKAAAKQPATPEAQPPAAAFLGGVIAASSLAATIGLVAVKAASAARR